MSEYIEIHWTSASLDEARKIARLLVEARLVACAQIIPWIESIYIWNGQLETTQETKVVFKTKQDFFKSIQDKIVEMCSYEVPEITSFEISELNPSYGDWLKLVGK